MADICSFYGLYQKCNASEPVRLLCFSYLAFSFLWLGLLWPCGAAPSHQTGPCLDFMFLNGANDSNTHWNRHWQQFQYRHFWLSRTSINFNVRMALKLWNVQNKYTFYTLKCSHTFFSHNIPTKRQEKLLAIVWGAELFWYFLQLECPKCSGTF